jgi:dihydroorotase-like cyclic amidohydrolase
MCNWRSSSRGARLHVAHLSTADALKAVRRGKRSKSHVTCEVTPHHFALTDADIGEYDTNFKMNPPCVQTRTARPSWWPGRWHDRRHRH